MTTQTDAETDYRREITEALDAQARRVRDLKRRAAGKAESARAEMDRELNVLQQRIAQTRRKLEELSEAREAAWEDFTEGLNRARDDIGAALDRIAGRFS